MVKKKDALDVICRLEEGDAWEVLISLADLLGVDPFLLGMLHMLAWSEENRLDYAAEHDIVYCSPLGKEDIEPTPGQVEVMEKLRWYPHEVYGGWYHNT